MKGSIATIFLLLNLLHLSSTLQSEEKPLAPALYAFGNSLSDNGNNNDLPTQAKANYFPYGVDFVGGITGRFTNGNTFVDFITLLLGLPFAPPYLGLSKDVRSKTITGLNYASGACGILPETGSRLGRCIPLGEQINYFERTVKEDLPQIFKHTESVCSHLAKSIFIVEIGTNDYLNNYLQPDFYNSSKLYTPEEFAKLLIHELSLHLKRLYELGARKMVVLELSALGCLPLFTNAVNFSNVCSEELNQMILGYNNLLHRLLNKLQSQLMGSKFVRGRLFDSIYELHQNPSKYGFEFTNIPCCKDSQHGTSNCLPNLQPCKDRDKYIFWDAFHPTQAVNAMLGVGCFNQSTSLCTPINIQQLACQG